MARKKLQRILEAEKLELIFAQDEAQRLCGSWKKKFFGNKDPIILELGCGKGEYALGISSFDKKTNVIGIDRKADRLWCAAKQAEQKDLGNLAFIHSKIENIDNYFSESEISGIWITFPDPYRKKPSRRLTAPKFLDNYRKILCKSGKISFKTDDLRLYEYTLDMLEINKFRILFATPDLYSSAAGEDPLNQLETTYEQKHISSGKKIRYISCMNNKKN